MEFDVAVFVGVPTHAPPRSGKPASSSVSRYPRATDAAVRPPDRPKRRPRAGEVGRVVATTGAEVAAGITEWSSAAHEVRDVALADMLVLDGREAWAGRVGRGRRPATLKAMDVFAEWLLKSVAALKSGTQVAILLEPPPAKFGGSCTENFFQEATALLRLVLGPTCIAMQPSSLRPDLSFTECVTEAMQFAPTKSKMTLATSDGHLQESVRRMNASIEFSPNLASSSASSSKLIEEGKILADIVPGVGSTRAARLLEDHGTLKGIVTAARTGTLGKTKTARNVLSKCVELEKAINDLSGPTLSQDKVDPLELRILVDNIPGVGPSKGTKLLQEFGSASSVVDAAVAGRLKQKGLQKTIQALGDKIRSQLLSRDEAGPSTKRSGWKPWIAINGAGPPMAYDDRLSSLMRIVDAGLAKKLATLACRLPISAQRPSSIISGDLDVLANIFAGQTLTSVLGAQSNKETALAPNLFDQASGSNVDDNSSVAPIARKMIIIDALGLIYRHFNALPTHLRSPLLGISTNAIQGFATTLMNLLEDHTNDLVVVVFDGCHNAPLDFRRKLDPTYKQNREPMPERLQEQIPFIKETIGALGVPMLEVASKEADDVIGTLVSRAVEDGISVTIMSADKDFFQLLQDGSVSILRPGSSDLVTVDTFKEQFGGLQPHQFVDYLALVGDSSDGIRGVKGIGRVTALSLLKEYGSVHEIALRLHDQKASLRQRKLLQVSEDELEDFYTLAKIQTDVDMDELSMRDLELSPILVERARELFTQLGFSVLLKKLTKLTNSTCDAGDSPGGGELSVTDTTDFRMPWDKLEPAAKRHTVVACSSAIDLRKKFALLKAGSKVGISLIFDDDEVVKGVGLGTEEGNSIICRFDEDSAMPKTLEEILNQYQVSAWDLKHVYKSLLESYGICLNSELFDLSVACKVLDPDFPLSLAGIASKYLLTDFKFDLENPSSAIEAGVAAHACAVLAGKLTRDLKTNSLYSIATLVEFPLVKVLAQMELTGLPIERGLLCNVLTELDIMVAETKESAQSVVDEAVENGVKINFNSPSQVGTVLFDVLGAKPSTKSTRSGKHSTNVRVLTSLQMDKTSSQPVQDLSSLVLKLRELVKIRGYVKGFLDFLAGGQDRIYARFNQIGAATGRLSVSKPNLQAVPLRSAIGRSLRTAVRASPGNVLICADYEQIELRILAALSGDKTLIAAFAEGKDVHSAVASKIFDVDVKDVTRELRNKAKQFNYGIPYGISAFGLSTRLGISVKECHRLITDYHKAFPGIRNLTEKLVDDARTKGFAETLQNRRRYLTGLNSRHSGERSGAERMAINTPIQGTQADMIKLAMIHISDLLKSLDNGGKLVLQVHDELLLEVPESEVDTCVKLVREEMTEALELPNDVAVVVDIGVGATWLEAMPH